MIVSIDAENNIWQSSISIHNKNLNKIGIKGNFLIIVEAIYEKPTASIIVSGEKLQAFSVRSSVRQGHSISPLAFDIFQCTCVPEYYNYYQVQSKEKIK